MNPFNLARLGAGGVLVVLRHLWEHHRKVYLLPHVGLVLFIIGLILLNGLGPGLGRAAGPIDAIFRVPLDHDQELSYEEALALGRRFDALYDQIEAAYPDGWAPAFDKGILDRWVVEVAPMFQYEGLSPFLTYPNRGMFLAENGMTHNHVLGRSDCNKRLIVNLRFFNSLSTWVRKPRWVQTVVHELAHVHQGPAACRGSHKVAVESTAQLMSWEVLAGLANRGNQFALFALVQDLRGVALNAAEARAIEEDRLDEFQAALFELLDHDPLKLAGYRAAMRFWAKDQAKLAYILDAYSATPLEILINHRAGHPIDGLALAVWPQRMTPDDLLYAIEHAEELVAAALSLGLEPPGIE